jgi:ribosomal protein S18 acetylase RimI-like enzyme
MEFDASSGITTRLFDPSNPTHPSDLRILYAIEEACFNPKDRFSRELVRSLAFDPDTRTSMAFVDGVCVGFSMVGIRGESIRGAADPTVAYLWTIEVLTAFRRRGAARRLLQRAEDSARAAGCLALELHAMQQNAGAHALYESMGYTRTGVELDFYAPGRHGLQYRKTF